jgi:glycosyltransferase involved in cell wall biosynthesis
VADRRPRVLFITIDLPRNGGSGGQIASWRLLETYADICDVDLIAITPPGAEVHSDLEGLTGRVELIRLSSFHYARARLRTVGTFLLSQFTSRPYRLAKFRRRRVRQVVERWLADQRYDLVHCDHLSSAQYRSLLPNVPAILMEHNVEWQILRRHADARKRGPARAILRRDARRTRSYEARALRRFDHVFTLSEDDRQELLKRAPDRVDRITVWPIPVEESPVRRSRRADQPLSVLVLGSLRSIGRLDGLRWFLRDVWPQVRRRAPDARLEIVGADPPGDISARDGGEGIRVHGYVESIDEVLERIDLCAIPLFVGGGIRIKVLELIARGIPCLGTEVALKGVAWLPGCLEVNSPTDWTEALALGPAARAALEDDAASGAVELAERHSVLAAQCALGLVLSSLGITEESLGHAQIQQVSLG